MGRRETRRRRRRRGGKKEEREEPSDQPATVMLKSTLTDLLFNRSDADAEDCLRVRQSDSKELGFSSTPHKKKSERKNRLLPLDNPPLQSDCFLCLANNNHLVLNEAAVPPEGSVRACAVAPPAGQREMRKSGRSQLEDKSTATPKKKKITLLRG